MNKLLIVFITLTIVVSVSASMPLPFKRELYYTSSNPLEGSDVYIAQSFLLRSKYVTSFASTKVYDLATKKAVEQFQSGNSLSVDGIIGPATANLLIKLHLNDGYKDDGRFPEGYLYKIHISVHSNRSIPGTAYLIAPNNTRIFKFPALTQGQGPNGGYNSFSDSGNTPTGLYEIDLNSPENDPDDFGPYPVNRITRGLAGNGAIVTPDTSKSDNIRAGLLVHCGQSAEWQKGVIPPSHGCIHSWCSNIQKIWKMLTLDLGVKVNKNYFGTIVPYPFKPQGVLSLELLDD
ncbi:l [Anaeramoeba flamelloides]|uniref:L n=1 Tax=Anaeramoeba flamelloides TaxID=1746091 RepID=A0ABQ8ZA21_9EUKA|nr:l [Anaeramoeba flamelloides] [Anaeramoeba flamelloides]